MVQMARSFIFAVLMAVLFLTVPAAMAEVYMLRDSRGVIFFTDHLPENKLNFTVLKKYDFQGQRSGARSRGYYGSSSGRLIFPSSYDSIIASAAARYNLDIRLIKSVIKVESGFNPYAVSRKGARGLMQLMPQTARDMNVSNAFDPADNINGGARYLRLMLNEFGGNQRLALAAYNAGPDAVKKFRGVPPYQETIDYVNRVNYAYSRLAGRIGAVEEPVTVARLEPSSARAKKTVFYTYKEEGGSSVFTDRPVGKKKILSD